MVDCREAPESGLTMRSIIAFAVGSICVLVAIAFTDGLTAGPKLPVEVGKTYIVAVDCLPIGCYSEVLRVDRIHDGWWAVTDAATQRTWMVNSARVYGVLMVSDEDLKLYRQQLSAPKPPLERVGL